MAAANARRVEAASTGGTVTRIVVAYDSRLGGDLHRHDRACQFEAARRLAALTGCEFAGNIPANPQPRTRFYVVPSAPLLPEEASRLGVGSEDDLLGAIVPYPFVATKAISHPLVRHRADAPPGWCSRLANELSGCVLSGFTVFNTCDAVVAGARLLENGPLRLKRPEASACAGQFVIFGLDELYEVVRAEDPAVLIKCGVVLEENLLGVTTYTVGETRAAGQRIGYFGTQEITRNREGAEAYGGSALVFVPGGMAALLATDLTQDERRAVEQALRYDRAACHCYPDLRISRRNYDVAQGIDGHGARRSGVLEQSWRIGGATPAEIAALEAFHEDPTREVVRARCVERYGPADIPDRAMVYFQGLDEKAGQLTKYVLVEP